MQTQNIPSAGRGESEVSNTKIKTPQDHFSALCDMLTMQGGVRMEIRVGTG